MNDYNRLLLNVPKLIFWILIFTIFNVFFSIVSGLLTLLFVCVCVVTAYLMFPNLEFHANSLF